MKVYVVTMYRYGNHEAHSYVLGVWNSKKLAEKHGNLEMIWRGGKYKPDITEWVINEWEV